VQDKPTNPSTIDIDFTANSHFNDFLALHKISLVLSTYQTGTVFMIAPTVTGKLHVSPVELQRSMGLWVTGNSVYAGGQYQIWRFENILPPGQEYQGCDRLYVPQVGWTTGDLDGHDIVVEKTGRLVFVNTRYSCLATVSESHNFVPLWRPPTISALMPEDRCHLNGLALRDGRAAYATAFSTSDAPHGWRETKGTGGVIWDLADDTLILEGLSMPYSPRWHGGKLWLMESGTGQFGWVDLDKRRFEPMVFCPGYLRGLAFYGDYAFIGASLPREASGFHGLPLDAELAGRGLSPRCGVFVVDCRRGEIIHDMEVTGGVQELYDVAILPNTRRPRAVSLNTEDIYYLLSIGDPQGSELGRSR
jgi:uncharacterized protein (TIGR03032 family)